MVPISVRWLFLGIILTCGDYARDTIEMNERQIRELLESSWSVPRALDALQSIQVLTYEKIDLFINRIEKKGIEKKGIEKNIREPVFKKQELLDFESAYILYPLKKGKSLGLKKLSKDIKTETDLELFKRSIVNYKKDLEINKTDAKYIKHFSTFCNEWKDWVDYVPIVLDLNKSKEQRVFDTAREQLARIERGEL